MRFGRLKEWVLSEVNKGTDHYTGSEEQRRVRQINVLNFFALLILFPFTIIYNSVNGNSMQLYITVAFALVFVVATYFNRVGKSQLGNVLIAVSAILGVYAITFVSETQTAYPFIFILLGAISIQIVEHAKLRTIIIIVALSSFVVLEYYSTKYLPFSEDKFYFLALYMVLFYVALRYWNMQTTSYQEVIEQKNKMLQEQNTKIREQSDRLLALEKEAHTKEIALKHRDIETVLANNRMQLQIRNNIISKLQLADENNINRVVNTLILDLKSQVDTQNKLETMHQNIVEVNSRFYDNLLAKHPDVSKSEKELCAYIKLRLSSKEMAALKNTSVNTINVSKTRLRKKMGLANNTELNTYLLNF